MSEESEEVIFKTPSVYLQEKMQAYAHLYQQWFASVKELRYCKTPEQETETREFIISAYEIKREALVSLNEAIVSEGNGGY